MNKKLEKAAKRGFKVWDNRYQPGLDTWDGITESDRESWCLIAAAVRASGNTKPLKVKCYIPLYEAGGEITTGAVHGVIIGKAGQRHAVTLNSNRVRGKKCPYVRCKVIGLDGLGEGYYRIKVKLRSGFTILSVPSVMVRTF